MGAPIEREIARALGEMGKMRHQLGDVDVLFVKIDLCDHADELALGARGVVWGVLALAHDLGKVRAAILRIAKANGSHGVQPARGKADLGAFAGKDARRQFHRLLGLAAEVVVSRPGDDAFLLIVQPRHGLGKAPLPPGSSRGWA